MQTYEEKEGVSNIDQWETSLMPSSLVIHCCPKQVHKLGFWPHNMLSTPKQASANKDNLSCMLSALWYSADRRHQQTSSIY